MKTNLFSRWLSLTPLCSLACLALALSVAGADTPAAPGSKNAPKASAADTHEQVKAVTVRSKDGKNQGLQTLCMDAEGRIIALLAPARGYGSAAASSTAEVQVLDADGKYLKHWTVDFHAQSINVGPDGCIYVAGDAKVAKFDKDGTKLLQANLPHIEELVKDNDGMRKKAEAQLKSERASFEQMTKQFTDRIAKLEAKPEKDRTKAEKTQLEQYRQILKSYGQSSNFYTKRTVEDVVRDTMSRLRVINAIAVAPKDVYICCGEAQGYGYAIWRLTPDFKEPKLVKSGVRGCCGQMDIQTAGDDLLIAENCSHQFARYDRDGKEKGRYGKRGKETDPGCFGGCCNPMNVRAAANGDIFTAESEGHVKRYAADGQFLGFVGSCKLQGGCKNVAIGVSPKGDRIYFCDQPGSRVLIMAEKKTTASKN